MSQEKGECHRKTWGQGTEGWDSQFSPQVFPDRPVEGSVSHMEGIPKHNLRPKGAFHSVCRDTVSEEEESSYR